MFFRLDVVAGGNCEYKLFLRSKTQCVRLTRGFPLGNTSGVAASAMRLEERESLDRKFV